MLQSEQNRDLPEQPKPLLGNRLNIGQLAVVLNRSRPAVRTLSLQST